MPYESQIAWRYLYRVGGSGNLVVFLVLSLLLAGAGFGLFYITPGGSGLAIMMVSFGLLFAVTFGLLLVFSVFSTVSVLGVVWGVAAMTVVLAVTSGFQKQFQDKVLGVNAHVIIMKNNQGFSDYQKIEDMAWAVDDDVVAVQPFIFVEMQVTRGQGYASGVAIKGIDPAKVSQVLDVPKQMVEGTVDTLAEEPEEEGDLPPIILGQVLAEKLKAKVGDDVTVVVPPIRNIKIDDPESLAEATSYIKFRITGIFYSGFAEYDQRLMYISLKQFQKLLDWDDKVMGVELKVRDVSRAYEIADKLDDQLSAPWTVQDWHELNKNLFTALTLQKIALVIVLVLIIFVALFNMVSALTMMVIDKTREIAILRSMGAPSNGVARVFWIVGIFIGGVGTASGLGIGLITCSLLSRYNYHLDPKVYLIDRLPVQVQLPEVLGVVITTMVIAGVAAAFPAMLGARQRPVDGLRYD
jgi:lipoprotein-releasing system permease protein